ncbi:MAG: alanine racemase [Clostridia bacterium]|nr:alanine racemase [Clostridia bacterium]
MSPLAHLSAAALLQNYRFLLRRIAPARPIAVVKANAYGHGMRFVATTLFSAGCSDFAVATAEEALALRALLPRAEILVLGHTPHTQLSALVAAGITPTAHDRESLAAITAHTDRYALKIDTGMHRYGFPYDNLPLHISPRFVFSHLYAADSAEIASAQIARFFAAARRYPCADTHLCASAGLLRYGAAGASHARAGLFLYGYGHPELTPVLTLSAQVIRTFTLRAGDSIGYGGAHRAARSERIALINIGYADGIPQNAAGGFMTLRGHPCEIVGRVSMDSCFLRLPRGLFPARGDRVTVYDRQGENIKSIAAASGRSIYELLVHIGTRIPRQNE